MHPVKISAARALTPLELSGVCNHNNHNRLTVNNRNSLLVNNRNSRWVNNRNRRTTSYSHLPGSRLSARTRHLRVFFFVPALT